MNIISWLNDNSGVFSLLVSVVAIVVSVYAVRAQNRGVVAQERLSLYREVYDTYKRCTLVAEHCEEKAMSTVGKFIAASNLFEYGSAGAEFVRTYKICSLKQDSTEAEQAEHREATKEYGKFLQKVTSRHREVEIELFFDRECALLTEQLYNSCFKFMRGITFWEEDEKFAEWKADADKILREFDEKKVLEKMKRKLPLK